MSICSWAEEDKEDLVEICTEFIGNTVCPHAMENNPESKTHVQRALGQLCVKGTITEMPSFESMIKVLKQSFPAETFSILKTEDEQAVIDCMYENPMFVEDVCRSILAKAKVAYKDKKLQLTAIARKIINRRNL